jgi:uncharacterized membrane protein YphA (DoxX/SURF4 family)
LTFDWMTHKALRQARFTMLTCALAAPALYAGAIATQSLGGRWERFLQGFDRIPWHHPKLPWIAALAVTTFATALLLPPRLQASSPLSTLRLRNLLTAVFLLVTAICGLYLGMKTGPASAPLAMLLLLGPATAGLLLFPTAARWRRVLEP